MVQYLRVAEGETSKAAGLQFVKALGITPEEADKLNDFTYEELVAASRSAGRGWRHGPTIDGKYIVQHPFDPTPAEFSKDVPMIIGSNLNEFGYTNRQLITPKTMER